MSVLLFLLQTTQMHVQCAETVSKVRIANTSHLYVFIAFIVHFPTLFLCFIMLYKHMHEFKTSASRKLQIFFLYGMMSQPSSNSVQLHVFDNVGAIQCGKNASVSIVYGAEKVLHNKYFLVPAKLIKMMTFLQYWFICYFMHYQFCTRTYINTSLEALLVGLPCQ